MHYTVESETYTTALPALHSAVWNLDLHIVKSES